MRKYIIIFLVCISSYCYGEIYIPGQNIINVDVFIPGSGTSDTSVITIYRYNSGTRQQLDFLDMTFGGTITTPTASMTWVGDGLWSYVLNFTSITNENTTDEYLYTINDITLGQVYGGKLIVGSYAQGLDTSGRVLLQPTQTGVTIPTVTAVTNDVGITQTGADKVWGTSARVLTAGTNIVLAKGTGVTGFNDLSAAQVNTEVDTAIADARLDELMAADSDIDGAAPPTVGSVFHELMSKTAGSFTFDQTTDSNEAIRDNLGGSAPTAAQIADAVWDEPKADHTTSTTFGDLATDLNTVAVDVAGLDDAATIWAYGGGRTITGGTIGTYTGDTPQTGDAFARLGVPAGASMSADIAAIEAQTDDIGIAGAGLTNIDLPNQTMNMTGDITGNLYGCDGCIAVTVSSGVGTMASPAVLSVTNIITYDSQFDGRKLRCGNEEHIIVKTVDDTSDSLVIAPSDPFIGALTSCYIK